MPNGGSSTLSRQGQGPLFDSPSPVVTTGVTDHVAEAKLRREMQAQLAILSGQVAGAMSSVVEFSQQLAVHSRESNSLIEQQRALFSRIAEFENRLQESWVLEDDKINGVNDRIAQIAAQYQTLVAQMDTVITDHQQLLEQQQEQHAGKAEFEKRIASLSVQINTSVGMLNQRLAALEAGLQALQPVSQSTGIDVKPEAEPKPNAMRVVEQTVASKPAKENSLRRATESRDGDGSHGDPAAQLDKANQLVIVKESSRCNPLPWLRQHRVAVAVGTAFSSMFGLVIGAYFYRDNAPVSNGQDGVNGKDGKDAQPGAAGNGTAAVSKGCKPFDPLVTVARNGLLDFQVAGVCEQGVVKWSPLGNVLELSDGRRIPAIANQPAIFNCEEEIHRPYDNPGGVLSWAHCQLTQFPWAGSERLRVRFSELDPVAIDREATTSLASALFSFAPLPSPEGELLFDINANNKAALMMAWNSALAVSVVASLPTVIKAQLCVFPQALTPLKSLIGFNFTHYQPEVGVVQCSNATRVVLESAATHLMALEPGMLDGLKAGVEAGASSVAQALWQGVSDYAPWIIGGLTVAAVGAIGYHQWRKNPEARARLAFLPQWCAAADQLESKGVANP